MLFWNITPWDFFLLSYFIISKINILRILSEKVASLKNDKPFWWPYILYSSLYLENRFCTQGESFTPKWYIDSSLLAGEGDNVMVMHSYGVPLFSWPNPTTMFNPKNSARLFVPCHWILGFFETKVVIITCSSIKAN